MTSPEDAMMKSVTLWLVVSILSSVGVVEAAEPAGDYAPGTLVIVDFGAESVGEVVEKSKTGWFKVRVLTKSGKELTHTLPPNRLSPAGPADKFGERFEKVRGPKLPAPESKGDSPAKPDEKGKPSEREPRERPTAVSVGALVVVDVSGKRVGEVMRERLNSRYEVQFIDSDGLERSMPFVASAIQVAAANQPYGLDLESGEVLASGKPSSKAAAELQRRKQEELDAKKAAGISTTLRDATPEGTEEIKKLVGSWKIVEEVMLGRNDSRPGKLVITPTQLRFAGPGEFGIGPSGEFRVDPTKSPKHLDFQMEASERKPEKREVIQGIYLLEGDRLKICLRVPTPVQGRFDRPIEFGSTYQSSTHYLVLTRLPDIATSPLKTSAEVNGTLLKALADGTAFLEAKEYQKFLDTFASAGVVRS